jgi:hypothetical protein
LAWLELAIPQSRYEIKPTLAIDGHRDCPGGQVKRQGDVVGDCHPASGKQHRAFG